MSEFARVIVCSALAAWFARLAIIHLLIRICELYKAWNSWQIHFCSLIDVVCAPYMAQAMEDK